MILNMSGGRVGVQYIIFSASQSVIQPSYLEIPNVSVPGGVLKGFIILKDDTTNELQDQQITFAYSNEEQYRVGGIVFEVFQSASDTLKKLEFTGSTGVIEYDYANKILKVSTPYDPDGSPFWGAGRYCLFVW